jgi:hypothetical protein
MSKTQNGNVHLKQSKKHYCITFHVVFPNIYSLIFVVFPFFTKVIHQSFSVFFKTLLVPSIFDPREHNHIFGELSAPLVHVATTQVKQCLLLSMVMRIKASHSHLPRH